MLTVGYLPYGPTTHSLEADWLRRHLTVSVRVAQATSSLNDGPPRSLPALAELEPVINDLRGLPAVVAEGPGGFLWTALLRAHGFTGSVTVLPYLNPRRWHDVAATALYRSFARRGDRIFVGSAPSAAVYRALGVHAAVGEPFGIDDDVFGLRPNAGGVRDELRIPPGPLMLFAGRAEPDKDVHRLLRVGLRAGVLFDDLQVVIVSHVVDAGYMAGARAALDGGLVRIIEQPHREQLADLYNVADVFVTASTSHFETFGRAPAEALACGCPAVAPCFDGFAHVLAQPGGTLVDVEIDQASGTPAANEQQLLRAVYDVLSTPCGPAREAISLAARQRFGRSRTIGLLEYLGADSARPTASANGSPATDGAPVVQLPPAWREALAEIAERTPADALAWFWHDCDHARLGAHDGRFAAQVRRSLCVVDAGSSERVLECR